VATEVESMPEPDDMDPDLDKPATRRDLDTTRKDLERVLEKHATKADLDATRKDLERVLEKYATKADLERALEKYATKSDLESLEQRVFAELAHHSLANREAIITEIRVLLEPYGDLPARVTRLEDAVFRPPRKRARRS
jgi:hypothetical protein